MRMKASATVRPTVSRPWLRRISAGLVAEARHQPLALAEIHARAFEVVVGDAAVEVVRVHVDRQQPARLRRHRHARQRVRVQVRIARPSRARCTALWITKPASFALYAPAPTVLPSASIFTRFDAVTSSKCRP